MALPSHCPMCQGTGFCHNRGEQTYQWCVCPAGKKYLNAAAKIQEGIDKKEAQYKARTMGTHPEPTEPIKADDEPSPVQAPPRESALLQRQHIAEILATDERIAILIRAVSACATMLYASGRHGGTTFGYSTARARLDEVLRDMRAELADLVARRKAQGHGQEIMTRQPAPSLPFGGFRIPTPGIPQPKRVVCSTCNGRGVVAVRAGFRGLVQATCRVCNGSGALT